MQIAMPPWLSSVNEDEHREAARVRFLIRVAALYYSKEGRMKLLSKNIGLHPNSLALMDKITPEMAIKLEDVLGRELFPRELFRPDIFSIGA